MQLGLNVTNGNKKLKAFCFRDSNSFIALTLSIVMNVVIWLYLSQYVKPFSDTFYLHYNIYFGVDLIGSSYKMYIIPLAGFVFIAVNYFLSCLAGGRNILTGRLVIWTTLLLQLVLFVAAYLIIVINS